MVTLNEDEYLAHYGILRRSGRYPWGSGGDDQPTTNRKFVDWVDHMQRQGMSEKDIATAMDTSIVGLRAAKSIAKNELRILDQRNAQKLHDKGLSNVAIGKQMGRNESSVRALLDPANQDKADVLQATADKLREEVGRKAMLDVSKGNNYFLGISADKFNTAVAVLEEEGYQVHTIPVPQIGTGKNTNTRVLVPEGVTWKDVAQNKHLIQVIDGASQDGGRTYPKYHPPISIDPKRVDVVYKGDGGEKADGVIYVRRGVEDVSLGHNSYAQIRVKVGDSHYLKGMAMYKDDLPDGVDLQFHTSKEKTADKRDAMKKLSSDPLLPFESVVHPHIYNVGQPTEHVKSVMNFVNEEGKWSEWNKNLSSQFLSKQSPVFAAEHLKMTYEQRKKDLDEIMSLTNPVVRKKLLEKFASGADSAAVHLKAAAAPRWAWHAILPINSLNPSQIYAPNYADGERVVLIRYPHGGKFEIPELTVNNKNREAKKIIGDGKDAVGIHHSVAERLSGADFDGDTVLVIPNNRGQVKTHPALTALKDFDPKRQYKYWEGMRVMTKEQVPQEMGAISNLITDMTIKGAPNDKIARAVKHSMVVIDAKKHKLDYKQSYLDNGIAALKQEYQGGARLGAATLISRAKSRVYVPERRDRYQSEGGPIDRVTGERRYTPTNRKKPGTDDIVEIRSKALAETTDAHSLSSGTRIEHIYAQHANSLKALANTARLAQINTPRPDWPVSARKAYPNQVASLNSKLALAKMGAVQERHAQTVASAMTRARKDANPDLEKDQLKRIRFDELAKARARLGGKKKIEIEPDEWEAIQAGAISGSKLKEILESADMDLVRQLATPRKEQQMMTSTKTQRAKQMLASGYTRAEVAAQLGVSLTTLDTAIKGDSP